MSVAVPFDPSSLPMEPDTRTRERHASVEWAPASKRPVFNDDYRLDPAFEPYIPSGGSWDEFSASYEEVTVHVTLFEDGVLFGHRFFVCDRQTPTLSADRTYLVKPQEISDRLDTLTKLEVPTGPTYLVGSNGGFRNHYHWMFQCLPSAILLRNVARERGLDYRIVVPPVNAVCRYSLELAGIDPSECITLGPDQFISGVPLLYTSACAGRLSFRPSARLIEVIDPFRNACLQRGDPSLQTRLYVSRRDSAGDKRRLENEDELTRVLEARGYQELLMAKLKLEDQVSAFARAESIVAPHGAGLVNLMFTPSSARVVEIMPEHFRNAHFFRIAQMRGIGYTEVRSEISAIDEENPRHGNVLRVDIEKVVAALEHSEALGRQRAA